MAVPPFKVKALFEYTSQEEDDLAFPNGQIITVTEEEDADWYCGEYLDPANTRHKGIFPKNFVERYEPETPPRPARSNRSKKDADAPLPPSNAQVSEAQPAPVVPTANPADNDATPTQLPKAAAAVEEPPSAPSAAPPPTNKSAPPETRPQTSAKPAQPTQSKAPPAVAEKPAAGSFRDRIAAFNKPAAPPVAPFKPGGLGSGGSSFIKKPFVAPPPSKDAYVPPPREAPQKMYRREEDPEIAERNSEDVASTERSAPIPSMPATGEDDDQPKPTSLKDRIALLQKQQQEQAARHAEAAQKKEKPKRPAKKRADSSGPAADAEEGGDGADLEKLQSNETAGRRSMEPEEEPAAAPTRLFKHRPSNEAHQAVGAGVGPKDIQSDANDADQSGAGETTEDAEETSTGVEDVDDKPRSKSAAAHALPIQGRGVDDQGPGGPDVEAGENEDEDEDEEEIDPEARRRMEIRERMAKMSGGMGMHGMFGPPGGMPPPMAGGVPKKPKTGSGSSKGPPKQADPSSTEPGPAAHAPPVPIMPLAGMPRPTRGESGAVVSKEKADEQAEGIAIRTKEPEEMPDVEDVATGVMPSPRAEQRGAPPPIPHERPAPPPPASERPLPSPSTQRSMPPPPPGSRPVPPAPATESPSAGSISDDEMTPHPTGQPTKASAMPESAPGGDSPTMSIPTSAAPSIPARPGASSNQSARDLVASTASPSSPTTPSAGAPRIPPHAEPSPTAASLVSARSPPPPPSALSQYKPLSRNSTGDTKPLRQSRQAPQDESDEEEVTEYEGDYDTDIASGATHKEALKAHARESSADDSTIVDESPLNQPNTAHPSHPPPIPSSAAPRAAPPPPPGQPPRPGRPSADMPRAAPPPVPPPKEHMVGDDGDEYDPYRYVPPVRGASQTEVQLGPTVTSPPDDRYEESNAFSGPARQTRPPQAPRQTTFSTRDRTESPSASSPRNQAAFAPQSPNRAPPRKSTDINRTPTVSRRSMDQARPSGEYGYIATDVDLGELSQWWAQPSTPPPVFQGRRDVLYEVEESSTSKRGGRTTISKDVYILFHDYSQTIVTARFDSKDPSDVTLEQRHEPPPQRLRQDQLEDAHARFGRGISEGASSRQNLVVGDGSPQALVLELLQTFSDALMPVAGRAYGALVYTNLANASVQQYDEIRPGDIITLRNAKFQGHKGAMHQKYGKEVGKPDHVGVVEDWDGTNKKVRAWEQGRENKKVKVESFKLGDLRSGEVKVWRVMARSWVGWEGQN